ncbi:MAG: serine/threonine-protein kinase, partial [Planctomycetota bacterium]
MRICITCEGVSEETPAKRCTHCGTLLLETSQVHYPQRRGETDATNPLIGKLIGGKYRILNVLGRGGMGTVFMAIHEVSLVPVAVKILHPRFASRPDYRSWFLAEASKAGRVVHENSARIQDVSESPDGSVYIAMEFVEGTTLADLLAGGRCLPAATTLTIMEQMLRALDAAHNSGVVHRDLTLRNVMVAVREGVPQVKVLDFGIAKGAPQTVPVLRSSDEESVPAAPQGLASPPYSAPEYLEGQEVDGRADLFSLGVIAYRCLTGRLPVASGTGAEMAHATIAGQIEALGQVPGVPARMQRLVDALIERDPEHRPASAAVVAEELRIIRESRGRLLRFASLAFLVVSVLVFAVAYIPRGAAFLRSVSGAGVSLAPGGEASLDDVQLVRSQDIRDWRLEYGSFDPQRLLVKVSREGVQLDLLRLDPGADHSRGELQIQRDADAREELAASLAKYSLEGAIRLEFELPGGTSLASVYLRVDDEAPAVSLSSDAEDSGILNGRTKIAVDWGGVEDLLALDLVLDGPAVGNLPRRIPVDLREGSRQSIEAILAEELDGFSDLGALSMRVEARDLTGNTGLSRELQFRHTDLRAPTVLMASRPDGGSRLTYNSEGAELEVLLSTLEPELEVIVRSPSGEEVRYPAGPQLDASRFRVLLVPARDGELYAEGRYLVWVSDRFGNTGNSFSGEFQFSSEDPSPQLDISGEEGEAGRAVRVADEIVTNGEEVTFKFRCNPIYSPERIVLSLTSDGSPVDLDVVADGPGEAKLVIPALVDGDYLLTVSMQDQRAAIQQEARYELRVLSGPVQLSLPTLDGARFLQEFIDKQVLQRQGENLVLGLAWRWMPEDLRLLRGRFWVGGVDGLDPLAELDAVESRAELLRGFRPRTGLNRIGGELRDVFGRAVRLNMGGLESDLPDGSRGEEILSFFHDPEPFSASDRTIGFEYGRDMRVLLESSLPFVPGDEVYLSLGEARLIPDFRSGPNGGFYVFRLPFRRVLESAAITGLT